jgi:DNA-binding transcriptional LysR family regulator
VTADSLSFIQGLAVNGAGIGLLPEHGCEAAVARGALVRILPAYAIRGGALHVVSPPLRHVPARVALLRDYLLKELPGRLGAPS